MALIECSFCGKATEAFEMVWSRRGKAICGRCVALFSADVAEVALSGKLTVECQSGDIEGLRGQLEGVSAEAKPQAESTHLVQRTNGERAVSYMHPTEADQRIVLKAVSPWLPERKPG